MPGRLFHPGLASPELRLNSSRGKCRAWIKWLNGDAHFFHALMISSVVPAAGHVTIARSPLEPTGCRAG